MRTRNRAPTHPGTILRELYLDPRGVKITAFADATGISRKHFSQIVNTHVGISPETAVRIAAVLDTTAQYWMNLQTAYDLWHAERSLKEGKPVQIGAFAMQQEGAVEARL